MSALVSVPDSSLAALGIDGPFPTNLFPPLSPNRTSYILAVPFEYELVALTIKANSSTAPLILVNGAQPVNKLGLAVGSNSVFITITAQDPGVTTNYVVNIQRDGPGQFMMD